MTRFATVALFGLPNSGKSTLINKILGQKIAPVHSKPQMTRKNLLAIYTNDDVQLAFVDTPGFHSSSRQLNRALQNELQNALAVNDKILLLFDVTEPMDAEFIKQAKLMIPNKDVVIGLNKIDLQRKKWLTTEVQIGKDFPGLSFCFFSAKTGIGVPELLKKLVELAVESPFLYEAHDVTTTNMRDIVAHFIQEKIMASLHQEIPYQTAVKIETYQESPKKDVIRAVIIVNQESQKPILIGKRGQQIQKIREAVEKELIELYDKKFQVHLFVKVDPNWVKNNDKIKEYL